MFIFFLFMSFYGFHIENNAFNELLIPLELTFEQKRFFIERDLQTHVKWDHRRWDGLSWDDKKKLKIATITKWDPKRNGEHTQTNKTQNWASFVLGIVFFFNM